MSDQSVVANIAAEWGEASDVLTGDARAKHVSERRQLAMWWLRERLGWSYPRIGAAFGGRNHATVIVSVRRAAVRLVESYPTWLVGELDKAFQEAPERFWK